MGKHFGKAIICDVLQMQREGLTFREIGIYFGLSRMQVKKLVERHRINEKNRETGILSKRKGRPRERFATSEEKLLFENRQLKMENELLRDFLHAIGRR